MIEVAYHSGGEQTGNGRQGDNSPTDSAVLMKVGSMVTGSEDPESLFNGIMGLLAAALDIQRGSITIYDEDSGDIFIDTSYGYSEEEAAKGKYRPGEGIIGSVIESKKPMVIPSIDEEPLFLNRTGARKANSGHNCAFICVPVVVDETVIGTLSIDFIHDRKTPLDRELTLLTAVAVIISGSLKDKKEMKLRQSALEEENRILKMRLSGRTGVGSIIGSSHSMQDLYEKILMVAPTATTVLITGETGTGKELIADAVYESSDRKGKPYVKVNVASLPPGLIESELFGHERGAFTGALSQKKGRFELAQGGAIFLDEIGDLDFTLQVKLLRVLQERRMERLGGTSSIVLDVLIIAATHRDLEAMVARNEFRQDLFYRLNVFPLFSPPLRERKADILLLADHFLGKYNREMNKDIRRISSEAIDMLASYHWPGNVRELENCIQRAVIISREDVIRSYHLPPSLQMASGPERDAGTLDSMTSQFHREIITDYLKMTHGNITRAAELLGTTKRILHYRMSQLGLDYRRFRG
ncbi:MAG TPA: sigma 54-interacting transcriptional regulator [Spirochaetota bacterium]|nr:sigma 54-interacting transcriptional regulator [Spirochaetota bacterium]HRZ26111.1 sigma 54-interacting transcriptional regulator [Spirochaetota bacterium]HSA13440.1 sigma 54-interacting transcriptional regulator [Spirochaetota bacterium]